MTELAQMFEQIISKIILDPILHAKWLNTLSYLENSGARKIAKCEDSISVNFEMLKHAFEEFRHAYYFKIQTLKIQTTLPQCYSQKFILGSFLTYRYLHVLDSKICKYLKTKNITGSCLKNIAYILVTYAIETRAKLFYDIYESQLRQAQSKITIRSVILEECGHLKSMKQSIESLPNGEIHIQKALKEEEKLCTRWISKLSQEIN